MPSPRASAAVTDAQRQAPPASEGLIAPSDTRGRIEARDREREDRKRGRKTDEDSDALVQLTMGLMEKLSAADIAREAGVDPRAVRSIIKSARASLATRAEFYVEAHAVATMRAAVEGDAKPAQWALERIAEEGERIIDPPQAEQAVAPTTFNIGFKIGGLPEGATGQPALVGEVVK